MVWLAPACTQPHCRDHDPAEKEWQVVVVMVVVVVVDGGWKEQKEVKKLKQKRDNPLIKPHLRQGAPIVAQ